MYYYLRINEVFWTTLQDLVRTGRPSPFFTYASKWENPRILNLKEIAAHSDLLRELSQ